MRLICRFSHECIIAFKLLGPWRGLLWCAAALCRPVTLLATRSLGHADRALGAIVAVRCPPGSLRLADTDFGICREIIGHDCYRVSAIASDIRTAIDLGCNSGVFSNYLARISPHCTITAVDANEEFTKAARRNAQRNNQEQQITVQYGLIGSRSRLAAVGPQPNGLDRDIPTIAVGDIVARMGGCDFLKCDVEGAEHDLFEGDAEWLKNVKRMSIEYHWNVEDGQRLAAKLKAFGFHTELAPHRDLGYIYAINTEEHRQDRHATLQS
jgi:FkbM family methyltransferase